MITVRRGARLSHGHRYPGLRSRNAFTQHAALRARRMNGHMTPKLSPPRVRATTESAVRLREGLLRCAETLIVPVTAAMSSWLTADKVDGIPMSFWWRHQGQRSLNAALINTARATFRRR